MSSLSPPAGLKLLAIARRSLERMLDVPERTTEPEPEPSLLAPGAAFVTLRHRGELRGCIGSLQARRPLADDVRDNARQAASRDPRFPPVTVAELDEIEIEVSVLSAAEELRFASEQEALAQLRPDVDGVVLVWREVRATLLPQVWESVPDPVLFLASLKRKAGLEPDFWHPEVRLARYTVASFHERGR